MHLGLDVIVERASGLGFRCRAIDQQAHQHRYARRFEAENRVTGADHRSVASRLCGIE
jgi:hypothetical protein